jgi:hypothetical protein
MGDAFDRWKQRKEIRADVGRKKASLTSGPAVSATEREGRRALARARPTAGLGPKRDAGKKETGLTRGPG